MRKTKIVIRSFVFSALAILMGFVVYFGIYPLVSVWTGNYKAYIEMYDVKEFSIPNGVTTIDSSAFSGCTSLTSITIPESVTSIGEGAFYGCDSLTSITMPFVGAGKDGTSNTHFGYIFGASSYSKNASYVPNSLKMVIVTGGTYIADYAFEDCDSLTSITIPESVTSIGSSAFSGCTSLTSITLPFVGAGKDGTGNTHFGYIFGASYLNNASYVPKSLKTVIITGGTYIADNAFYYCTNLTSIKIPESVTSIGNYAFSYCDSLTSVTIPESVTSIGSSAFYGCTGLTIITVDSNNTVYQSIGDNLYTKDGKTLIQYAIGKTDSSFVIPNSVTTIDDYAFYDCNSLTSITISESVTSIGNYVFSSCYRLTSITIPEGVTSIGNSAFSYCHRLTSITIPEGVTSIGNSAFSYCDSLMNITIPESVTSIGSYAFYRTSLTSITIPESVTSIGNYAFKDCDILKNIIIPESVTSIGDYAFEDCDSLTSIKYRGTESQWSQVSKGYDWDWLTGLYTITYEYKGE